MTLGCSAPWRRCLVRFLVTIRDGTMHYDSLPEGGRIGSAVGPEDGAEQHSGFHRADALPMLQQRLPELTQQVTHHVSEGPAFGCLGELQEATERPDPLRVRRPTRLGGTQTRCPTTTSSSMVGSTTRLPLPNTTFGRR